MQPRPHHRAHYETEGSRGAVKAAPTGHPLVKVGQADMQKSSLPLSFIKMVLDFVQVKLAAQHMMMMCPSLQLCGYTERKPLSLQVFVGTADDRSIRPHPFYQIHRCEIPPRPHRAISF